MSIKGNFKITINNKSVGISIGVDDPNVSIVNKGGETFKVKWNKKWQSPDSFASSWNLGTIGTEFKNNKKYNFRVKVWTKKKRRTFTRYRNIKSKPITIKKN